MIEDISVKNEISSSVSKIKLAIVGAGDYGTQVLHWAEVCRTFEVVGFFDDYIPVNTLVKGKPILGTLADILQCYTQRVFEQLFIAIGYKHARFKHNLFMQLCGKIPFATIIAKPIYIDNTAKIGKNVLICPGCIIGEDCNIEDNVKLSPGVAISHNSQIGMGTYCSPSVNIAGFSRVGQCCFIGIGATIIDGVTICDDVTIGAQSLVLNNIDVPGTYVGVPAKKIK